MESHLGNENKQLCNNDVQRKAGQEIFHEFPRFGESWNTNPGQHLRQLPLQLALRDVWVHQVLPEKGLYPAPCVFLGSGVLPTLPSPTHKYPKHFVDRSLAQRQVWWLQEVPCSGIGAKLHFQSVLLKAVNGIPAIKVTFPVHVILSGQEEELGRGPLHGNATVPSGWVPVIV